jgi:CheY-like chemotaxis protein
MEPKKVLIVDDEEILTWIMSKTLSKDQRKYEILVANDGNKALEIMETAPVELVITDIRMPGMSGFDLLEEIRLKHPKTKIIIMTAYGNPDVQKEASERGCLHYLEKPFKIEDLRNLILDAIKVSKKGFMGHISDLQLTDIIQLNCLGRMKNALSITMDDVKGVIYFQDGEIIHAECGNIKGEEAVYTILGWDGGDFQTISDEEPLEKSINRSWQELLIEAMRRKDEGHSNKSTKGRAAKQHEGQGHGKDATREEVDFDAPEIDYSTGQPASTESEAPAVSSSRQKGASTDAFRSPVAEQIPKEAIDYAKSSQPHSTKEKAALLHKILVEWQENSEEIQGAAVVTLDGFMLAAHVSHGRTTGEQLGALTASVYKIGSKGLKALKRGALQELYLRGAQGTLHLYCIDSVAILSVLARPDANMGMVHIESREQCKRVGQVFGL